MRHVKATEEQVLIIPWAGKSYRILLSSVPTVFAVWLWICADGDRTMMVLAALLTVFDCLWMFSVAIEIHPAARQVKRVTRFLDSFRLREKCFPLDAFTAIRVRFSFMIDSEGNSAHCHIDLMTDATMLPVAFYQRTMWKDQAAIDWQDAEATIASLVEVTKLPVVRETELS